MGGFAVYQLFLRLESADRSRTKRLDSATQPARLFPDYYPEDVELFSDVETGVFRLVHIGMDAASRFGVGISGFIEWLETWVFSPPVISKHEYIPHGLFIPAK